MVEGENRAHVQGLADAIADVVKNAGSDPVHARAAAVGPDASRHGV
jgi:hypothetical protein